MPCASAYHLESRLNKESQEEWLARDAHDECSRGEVCAVHEMEPEMAPRDGEGHQALMNLTAAKTLVSCATSFA